MINFGDFFSHLALKNGICESLTASSLVSCTLLRFNTNINLHPASSFLHFLQSPCLFATYKDHTEQENLVCILPNAHLNQVAIYSTTNVSVAYESRKAYSVHTFMSIIFFGPPGPDCKPHMYRMRQVLPQPVSPIMTTGIPHLETETVHLCPDQ